MEIFVDIKKNMSNKYLLKKYITRLHIIILYKKSFAFENCILHIYMFFYISRK